MRRTILCGNLLLLVVLCDDVFGQARGGAGGIGAASGGPGGPGIGVSGGGTAALGNSFSAWAGLNPSGGFGAPQTSSMNAAAPHTPRPAAPNAYPTLGGSSLRTSRMPTVSRPPDVRSRPSISREDDLYLGLPHSVLGNPHGDSRRPRKKVGSRTVGANLLPAPGLVHHHSYFDHDVHNNHAHGEIASSPKNSHVPAPSAISAVRNRPSRH